MTGSHADLPAVVNSHSVAAIAAMLKRIYATPPAVVDKARELPGRR